MCLKILLVDDHPIVRAGLRMLVQSQPGFEVAGEAANRSEAVRLAHSLQPNVILLDQNMGEERGIEAIPELLTVAPQARVLVLTGVSDSQVPLQAARLGAQGVISKEQPNEHILQAIERVHAGEAWFDGAVVAKLLAQLSNPLPAPPSNPAAARIAALTPRERKVIELVCQGLKNQQIADALFISEGTIRNHLTGIYQKLAVADRFGLIVFANQHDLANLPH